jgi:hypothetical protein
MASAARPCSVDDPVVSHAIDNRTFLAPWDLVLWAETASQKRNVDCDELG